MWKNFDAYVSPDGRVHNNAQFVGEQNGLYRFDKCLAEHGITLTAGPSNEPPKPHDMCTQEELASHPGDCWIKLSVWEKRLAIVAFEYGWLHSFNAAKSREYGWIGISYIPYLLEYLDEANWISYFDQLYDVKDNRSIQWDDAFDLMLITQNNPKSGDIRGLTTLYRRHEAPLLSGNLKQFVPPNKVVIQQTGGNMIQTIALLSVSGDSETQTVTKFMAALMNVRKCNTLTPLAERKQQERESGKKSLDPQLRVVIEYPQPPMMIFHKDIEFFNGKNELSGEVLLDKTDVVCQKEKGEGVANVKFGELLLEGAKDQNEFSPSLGDQSAANSFIDLNRYLIANKLGTLDRGEDDPRQRAKYYQSPNDNPTPDGVKRILTVGAGE